MHIACHDVRHPESARLMALIKAPLLAINVPHPLGCDWPTSRPAESQPIHWADHGSLNHGKAGNAEFCQRGPQSKRANVLHLPAKAITLRPNHAPDGQRTLGHRSHSPLNWKR